MTVLTIVIVSVLVAFLLGWWGHGWWAIPTPVAPDQPQTETVLTRGGLEVERPETGLCCVLQAADGTEVSRQTRRGSTYPTVIERPHGRQRPTVYALQGIANGVGLYREQA